MNHFCKATATTATTATTRTTKFLLTVQNSFCDNIEHIIVCFLTLLLSLDYFIAYTHKYTIGCERIAWITLSPVILPIYFKYDCNTRIVYIKLSVYFLYRCSRVCECLCFLLILISQSLITTPTRDRFFYSVHLISLLFLKPKSFLLFIKTYSNT